MRQETETSEMQRTPANPWDWSLKLGYNQGEIIEGAARRLICAGQTAVDDTGAPQHPGDMRAQIGLALDNLEAVLAEAGMGLSDVIRLGIYATDVDEALEMHSSLFGITPVHPASGKWLWQDGELVSSIFGTAVQPVQPEYVPGDRAFGLFPISSMNSSSPT